VDGDRFIVVSLVVVDHCIPCGIFQIHWDSHDSVKEEIVVVEDLGVGVNAKKMHSSFRHKNAISCSVAGFGCHSCKKFSKKLSVLRFTFHSNHFRGNFRWVTAMTEPHLVYFKGREDRCKLIAVGHGFELDGFEVGCKIDCCFGIYLNRHALIDEVLVEVGKVSNRRVDFCKVANSNWTFGAKTVGFKEYFGFLEPSEEVRIGAVELDAAK